MTPATILDLLVLLIFAIGIYQGVYWNPTKRQVKASKKEKLTASIDQNALDAAQEIRAAELSYNSDQGYVTKAGAFFQGDDLHLWIMANTSLTTPPDSPQHAWRDCRKCLTERQDEILGKSQPKTLGNVAGKTPGEKPEKELAEKLGETWDKHSSPKSRKKGGPISGETPDKKRSGKVSGETPHDLWDELWDQRFTQEWARAVGKIAEQTTPKTGAAETPKTGAASWRDLDPEAMRALAAAGFTAGNSQVIRAWDGTIIRQNDIEGVGGNEMVHPWRHEYMCNVHPTGPATHRERCPQPKPHQAHRWAHNQATTCDGTDRTMPPLGHAASSCNNRSAHPSHYWAHTTQNIWCPGWVGPDRKTHDQ